MRVMQGIVKGGGLPFRDSFHVSFSMFVDRKGVMDRLDKKVLRILGGTGAYTMGAMRKSIRPPTKKQARSNRITVRGVNCIVPVMGKVREAGTGQPVHEKLAVIARKEIYARNHGLGAGSPPRRGPTDLLRSRIFFGVETNTETVVIGPEMFTSQPKMIGAVSVPQLLDQGGKEEFRFGHRTFVGKYEPRPFVAPMVPVAQKRLEKLIEDIPL